MSAARPFPCRVTALTVRTRTFILAIVAILALGVLTRSVWLTADPPVRRAVGIVWHDEGAWVHNARNAAIWGQWRTDAWNPMFVAPVFTALEYLAFETFGVGTWQARTVPAVSGLVAVAALIAGLRAVAGRRAALMGGVLLTVNYAFVMWNRAALMESTMTAFLAVAWMAWACSERRPVWGAVAGVATVAAFFTKAAAAFFIPALTVELGYLAFEAWGTAGPERQQHLKRIAWAVAGLTAAALFAAAVFVLPWWDEYQFYNWQMSVTRKPAYTLGALVDRATWLPIVQGLFSGMAIEVVAAVAACFAVTTRWREARSAERLLVLWIIVGLAELIVHDSGNERRYVMFIPALVALAALLLSGRLEFRTSPQPSGRTNQLVTLTALPLLLYVLAGTLVRPWFEGAIEAGQLAVPVRLSAALALAGALLLTWRSRRVVAWLSSHPLREGAAAAIVGLAVGWQLVHVGSWATMRTFYNYDASVALGALLEPGTLVQGKLANGMALESEIRPLFVGNGFGNFDDRLSRDDARYILTYDLPRIGYESSDGSGLIQSILDHYPGWRTVATFVVDETRGEERAALIDKFPDAPAHARD
jgi:4-amino-4-deoxy-L-arabinose transferase-like glycosyltransferase